MQILTVYLMSHETGKQYNFKHNKSFIYIYLHIYIHQLLLE